MAQSQLRLEYFKAPEGQYQFHSERPSRSQFSTSRACRLTYAELPNEARPAAAGRASRASGGGAYVIHNTSEYLHISEYTNPDREPLRSMCCGSTTSSGPGMTWPTCHAHSPTPDGVDLLIGLNTGDVLATSLTGQVAAQRGDSRRATCLHFNAAAAEGSSGGGGGGSDRSDRSSSGRQADGSRVAGVAWLSPALGTFAAGHASGTLYIYQMLSPGQDGGRIQTQLRSVVSVAGPEPAASIRTGSPITGVAASPDGAAVAVSCADGVLRIFDVASQRLTGGFKSYYGGLLCCTWSPDGRFIATGGEDDLISLYSCEARCVVAWGAGHHSWVSAVAFDTWAHDWQEAEGLVRVLSCGHDGQLALWDFDLSPEALTPVSPSLGQPPAAARRLFGQDARPNGAAPGPGPAAEGAVAPAALHADMDLQPPVRLRKLHAEPVSAVLPTPGAVFLASYAGTLRCWRRPPPPPRRPPPQQDEEDLMENEQPLDASNGPAGPME